MGEVGDEFIEFLLENVFLKMVVWVCVNVVIYVEIMVSWRDCRWKIFIWGSSWWIVLVCGDMSVDVKGRGGISGIGRGEIDVLGKWKWG